MPPPERVAKWLGKLTKLNPATGNNRLRGKAPHKPLLLLCLLDMAQEGEINQRTLTRTPGLVLRFKTYGALVAERWPTRLNLCQPFFHLSTQKFWRPFTMEMAPAVSPENCFLIELDEEFFELLADADFRTKARLLLISRYFEPTERVALLETLGFSSYGPARVEMETSVLNEEAEQAARKKGRSARFAVQVVSTYRFTCALTGLQCVTVDGCAIVDAAHIERFAATQNDDITNGLALSKNSHWAFDEGLWSIGADGRIIIANHRFSESGPEQLRITSFGGRFLQFAHGVSLRPAPDFFKRHREFHGFAR